MNARIKVAAILAASVMVIVALLSQLPAEIISNGIILYIGLSVGTVIGFMLCALMVAARDADRGRP